MLDLLVNCCLFTYQERKELQKISFVSVVNCPPVFSRSLALLWYSLVESLVKANVAAKAIRRERFIS